MATQPLIDTMTFSRRLVALCLRSGLIGFPAKPADRAILEKSMTMLMDPAARYSQHGVDEILKQWIATIGRKIRVDHVTLRRALVDDGYVDRRPDGARYRLNPPGTTWYQFSPDVDRIDIKALIADEARAIAARRQQHVSGSKS